MPRQKPFTNPNWLITEASLDHPHISAISVSLLLIPWLLLLIAAAWRAWIFTKCPSYQLQARQFHLVEDDVLPTFPARPPSYVAYLRPNVSGKIESGMILESETWWKPATRGWSSGYL
jgi:hypothetical protein